MPVPALRVRIVPRHPARIQGTDGVGVVRTGGVVTIRQDWSGIAPGVGPFDQQAYEMLGRDAATGQLIRLPLSASRAAATRRITAAGDVTVLPTDGVILINKTVAEPTSVNLLPSASGYVISIKDEGEDASSYPITLVPDGSDLIDGQASYEIGINGGAVNLQPVVGGWAVLTEFLGSDPLPITRGGTGAADAANARSSLGLGAIATLNPGTGLTINGSALDLAVPDDSITFAKVQNIATARLLGRTTASSGNIEELTVGAGLTLAGGELSSSAVAPSGAVINSVSSIFTTAGVSYTTVIPQDDTIPQITEGTEIQTVSITASNASNKIRLRWRVQGTLGATGGLIFALFKDSGANAIAAGNVTVATANYAQSVLLETEVTAGDTSAHTYRARVGPSTGTAYLNGNSSGRLFGGVSACVLVAEEIKA
jgi:hypothetical protein